MSITSDIRAYADTALAQGKQVGAKATSTVADLRAQAEKALNLEAVKSAIEPYLAQAKEYRSTVTDRANGLVGTVTGDKRVAKLVDTAETVVGTVSQRVVKPVQSLTGRGKPAAKPAAKPARKSTVTKPASTRPGPKPATARKSTSSTAKKSTTKA